MTIYPAPYRENSRLRYKWVLSLAAPCVTKTHGQWEETFIRVAIK